MEKTETFCIAGHVIDVVFADANMGDIDLLPSFEPFRKQECPNGGKLFTLHVDDSLRPLKKDNAELIGTFDTGNGDTIVSCTADGRYQYIIKDIHGNSCCLLQADSDFVNATCALNGNSQMRHFGLNNALMMLYAFRGSFFQTLLIHASLVRENGYGYAFIAKSGTGKSTHTSLWLKHIPNTDLMNDDNPIVRIIDGKAYIYGSPWSGKTPCYRDVVAKLGAITQIARANANSVERLSPTAAFAHILPACSTMKWHKAVFRNTYDTVISIIEASPRNYVLHCLPDKEAALVCHEAISLSAKHTDENTSDECLSTPPIQQ